MTKRSRALMYVQKTSYLMNRFKGRQDLEKHLETRFSDAEWAFILHDKDIENGQKADDHMHIAFYFENPRTPSRIATMMGEDQNNKGQSVEVFGGRWGKNNMFAYLIHATAGAAEDGKHRYSPEEVTANFDYTTYVNNVEATAESNKMDKDDVIAGIINGDITMSDFFKEGKIGTKHAATLFYVQHKRDIEKAVDARYKLIMKTKGEEMGLEIIYFQGKSGSGKTTLAKEYAMRKYGDYFMTGSSNDPLQDYMGEPVAIFDDARPSDFDAGDWLKMLDPYNNKTSVNSRYYNKYLAVKCIIITTTTPFHEFFVYAKNKAGVDEPISQFMRRFGTVVEVSSEMKNDDILLITGLTAPVKRLDKKRKSTVGDSDIEYEFGVVYPEKAVPIKYEMNVRDDNEGYQTMASYF